MAAAAKWRGRAFSCRSAHRRQQQPTLPSETEHSLFLASRPWMVAVVLRPCRSGANRGLTTLFAKFDVTEFRHPERVAKDLELCILRSFAALRMTGRMCDQHLANEYSGYHRSAETRLVSSGYGFTGSPFHHSFVGVRFSIAKWRWGVPGGAFPVVPT